MSELRVVALAEADPGEVTAFFRRVPKGDRTFFKEDVLDLQGGRPRRDRPWG